MAIETDSGPINIFYEVAGQGKDVLLLHTAGADSRQYHDLMRMSQLTNHYRLIAFDLPGHGRSDPWPGIMPGEWQLSTERYIQIILAVQEALSLQRPVLSGSSMGGAICLQIAYQAADRFHGVIACEASDYIPGRKIAWAKHSQVNQSLFVPEWIYGLISPYSPDIYRRRIWWGYSQGGYATFAGDIDFYSGEWDGRQRMSKIDTQRCSVVMMTGEYDYSCTPAMSEATANKIPGALYWTMPKLGHFPMAENPPYFAEHFLKALQEMDA
ncbi:hypothetical protein BC443_02660 [Salinicola sp. MIT1003]|nr:hypothetical protein BC443_02660 [Salinicola sp. MIT1003]